MRGRGTEPVIPNNPRRRRIHPFDRTRYKQRNLIERTVGRLKAWRRIHTRYDKLDHGDDLHQILIHRELVHAIA